MISKHDIDVGGFAADRRRVGYHQCDAKRAAHGRQGCMGCHHLALALLGFIAWLIFGPRSASA